MTRPILINSRPIVEDKNIRVELAVKGRDFMVARGFEKLLEDIKII